jgi:hypothetical protein
MLKRIPFLLALLALSNGCDEQKAAREGSEQPVAQAAASPLPDKPITDPFPTAAELKLFVETEYAEDGAPIMSKPDGLRLTKEQRADFEATLLAKTPPDEVAACFIPHHFFRYYNSAGDMIGEIQACFCCSGVVGNVSVPAGQELAVDYGKLERLIESLGEPVNVLCGEDV